MVAYYFGHHYGVEAWQAITVTTLVVVCIMAGIVMVGFLALFGEQPVTPMHHAIVGGYMLIGHAFLQIGATIVWFAYMAEGWDQAVAATIMLVCISWFEREKFTLWLSGQLRPIPVK